MGARSRKDTPSSPPAGAPAVTTHPAGAKGKKRASRAKTKVEKTLAAAKPRTRRKRGADPSPPEVLTGDIIEAPHIAPPDEPTPAQLATLRRAAMAHLSRDRLLAWVCATHETTPYSPGWVHADICARLERFSERVARKESPRLIICLPPRAGKSAIVSQRWPVWHMGRYPTSQIYAVSYSSVLADTNSGIARSICRNPFAVETFPGLQFEIPDARGADGQPRPIDAPSVVFDQVDRWGTAAGGMYRSFGLTGSLTGGGADVLIVDDPIKGRVEAESKTIRDKVWATFHTDAMTRLSPGGGAVVMCTRWHGADLVGQLLEQMHQPGGEQWEVVNYPAIAERDERFRKAGAPLHPARYDLPALEAMRGRMAPYDWYALYQQRPTPADGAIIERAWLDKRRIRNPLGTTMDEIMISVDCTFKDTKGSDFVVMQAWGRRGALFCLLDQVRARLDFVKTAEQLVKFRARFPTARQVLVEDKANGPAVIAYLQRVIPALVPFNPGAFGSKVARLRVVSPLFFAGNVLIPEDAFAPWVAEYIHELTSFPSGKHDDQVDATSMALLQWTQVEGTGAARLNAAYQEALSVLSGR